MTWSRGLAGLTLALVCAWAFAQTAVVAVPPLGHRVTDLTGSLPADQVAQLEARLRDFENRKGSQIAVLIVPTTQPESIEQYGIRVAEAWKLGRKKVDDGAILLIAKDDRALRIEVGYGLEGPLNDAVSKRIISEIIVPKLQQGDFPGAVSSGADAIMKVVDGEPLPPPAPRSGVQSTHGDFREILAIGFMAIIFLGGLLRSILGRLFGAIATGTLVGLGIAFLFHYFVIGILLGVVAFFITLASGNLGMAGMMLGGFGGSGGGGGGGGGGFSGGGGGFGGGGASGRW
ncbi:MAG: YgcG family protein [Burkholderiaceae bacterium]|jgi:uncharacterized protein